MQEYDARSRLESLPPEVLCEIFKLLLFGDSRPVESLLVSTKQLHAVFTRNEQYICRDHIKDFFRMATKVVFLQEKWHIPSDWIPMVQHFGKSTVLIASLPLLPPCIADQFLDHDHAFGGHFREYLTYYINARQTHTEIPAGIASRLPVREKRSNDKEVQIIFEDFWRCKTPRIFTLRSWVSEYEEALQRGMKDGELTLRSLRMWNTLLQTIRGERASGGGWELATEP
ncbi:MAG: hypothetical protein Q9184_007174 [Pyrenodesmia sp. 2 TL-2023]